MKTVHAVFEKGVFRPLDAVELPECCEVEFEPRPVAASTAANGSLDAVYAILSERYESGEHDVAERHNEHQQTRKLPFRSFFSVSMLLIVLLPLLGVSKGQAAGV